MFRNGPNVWKFIKDYYAICVTDPIFVIGSCVWCEGNYQIKTSPIMKYIVVLHIRCLGLGPDSAAEYYKIQCITTEMITIEYYES